MRGELQSLLIEHSSASPTFASESLPPQLEPPAAAATTTPNAQTALGCRERGRQQGTWGDFTRTRSTVVERGPAVNGGAAVAASPGRAPSGRAASGQITAKP